MAGTIKKSFKDAFKDLPDSEKLRLVQKQFFDLLDEIPEEQAPLSKVNEQRKRLEGKPDLNRAGRMKELDYLYDAISRDAKQYYSQERTSRRDYFPEIMSTVENWLNDIWVTVFVHKTDFEEAFECLYSISEISFKILGLPVLGRKGCRCELMNTTINIDIRLRDGALLKRWRKNGAEKLMLVVIPWMYRELFLAYLVSDRKKAMVKIPHYMDRLEDFGSWRLLVRVLYGGKYPDEDELMDLGFENDDDDPDGEDDESFSLPSPQSPTSSTTGSVSDTDDSSSEDSNDEVSEFSDDDDSEFEDDQDLSDHFLPHWGSHICDEFHSLYSITETKLRELYKIMPSSPLMDYIVHMSPKDDAYPELSTELLNIAGNSSDVFVSAVRIAVREGATGIVNQLLEMHSYLFRPRDYDVFQMAVSTIDEWSKASPYVEAELNDTVDCIRAVLRFHFSGIDETVYMDDFAKNIIKTRQGTSGRKEKVAQWVHSVITSTVFSTGGGPVPAAHPFNFAAMMMGLPPAVMDEEPELFPMDGLDFLDEDREDEDDEEDFSSKIDESYVADMRDEFRPRLQERFQGWARAASGLGGKGQGLLLKTYLKLVKDMPIFKAPDVIDEMVSHLAPYTSKNFLAGALRQLNAFCKQQRKVLKKAHEINAKNKASGVPAGPSSATVPKEERKMAGSQRAAAASTPGNTNDEESDDEGPPPLEPVPMPSGVSNPSVLGSRFSAADQSDDEGPPPLEPVPMPSNSSNSSTYGSTAGSASLRYAIDDVD